VGVAPPAGHYDFLSCGLLSTKNTIICHGKYYSIKKRNMLYCCGSANLPDLSSSVRTEKWKGIFIIGGRIAGVDKWK